MDERFDKRDQWDRIVGLVVPGEELHAVYDMKGGGTGFIGITDRRVIFLDESFVRKSKALVSVPFSRVTAVGVEDSGRTLNPFASASKLILVAGVKEWEFEFRSVERAKGAYLFIMQNLLQAEQKGMALIESGDLTV